MIGERYGRLVIKAPAGFNSAGQRKVQTVCDCGTEKTVLLYKLINRSTQSCGCLNRELISERNKRKVKSEVGNIYGRLTVISEKGSNGHRQMTFNCLCSCGRKIVATGQMLRRRTVNSCGDCGLHAEIMAKMGELGMVGRAK